MKRLFKLLRVDTRGGAVVELALAAPFLGALVVGMTDLSRAYAMKLRLAQAAQRAIESVQVNGKNTNDYTGLSAEATAAATAPRTSFVFIRLLLIVALNDEGASMSRRPRAMHPRARQHQKRAIGRSVDASESGLVAPHGRF